MIAPSRSAGPALAGRKLLLLPRYPAAGASSRLRMNQFIPALAAAGADVTVKPFFDNDYLRAYYDYGRKPLRSALAGYARRAAAVATARADLIWVEKELFPFLPATAERPLRWRRATYVVDYDDAIFHNYDAHPRRVVRMMLGRKLDPLLAGAAAITAGNAYLAEYAARHGARRVERIPTVVDPRRYSFLPSGGGGSIRIGWIGTPANARYLSPVIEAMRRLQPTIPMVLVTMGASLLPDLPVTQERHEWSEDREAAMLATVDIGVMPLPDDPFERGKCGYKLIQYMAAGRPVIASPVGVNADIVDPAVGLLADSADAWAEAIRLLAANPERRRAMGAAGRERVERVYSLDVVAPRLVALFAELLGEP